MKVVEVKNSRDYKKFLDFPKKLYFDILKTTKFIMPLKLITRITIGSYKAKSKTLIIVEENGDVLARLGAKVHKYQGQIHLHIGFFECVPDRPDIAQAMFDYVHAKHPELEMTGPYGFRMEDPYMGLLIKGFEIEPSFMMAYNPDYYNDYFIDAGFKPVMDVLAYDVIGTTEMPDNMREKKDECEAKGFNIRYMNPKKMKQEVRTIAKIFNDSLSDNWGFEELIDEQVKEMYLMFKFFINPEVVAFTQKDGEDVGCLIMLPNFNPLIQKTKGGITPSLLWDILTKKKKIDSCRGYALGVKKKFHGNGLGSFLVWHSWYRSTRHAGFKKGEISWILSHNDSMNNLVGQMQGEPNKTYRIFNKKALTAKL